MITLGVGEGGTPLMLRTFVEGIAIYLDNFAIVKLAKGDAARRSRVVKAIQGGGAELLFSMANAVELVGPEGTSRELVKSFLRELGPHWFPVELDTHEVCEKEGRSLVGADAFAANDLLKKFFLVQMQAKHCAEKVIGPGGSFFNLDVLVDWLATGKDKLIRHNETLDATLIRKVNEYRDEDMRDSSWLDKHFPRVPFRSDMPATFTYINLLRNLVRDRGYQLKKGDGLDFSHAVFGSAFASIVTLDKHWKRRVEELPTPNGLAKVYYEPELDQMVSDIEAACARFQ